MAYPHDVVLNTKNMFYVLFAAIQLPTAET